MFHFRKKSVIKVTFDPYHNLPRMKAKNCTTDQIRDAGLFMRGHAKIDCQKTHHHSNKPGGKKENKLHKFFRILSVILFGNRKTPTVEDRMKRAYNCRHYFHPVNPDELTAAPAALPAKV